MFLCPQLIPCIFFCNRNMLRCGPLTPVILRGKLLRNFHNSIHYVQHVDVQIEGRGRFISKIANLHDKMLIWEFYFSPSTIFLLLTCGVVLEFFWRALLFSQSSRQTECNRAREMSRTLTTRTSKHCYGSHTPFRFSNPKAYPRKTRTIPTDGRGP